MNELQTFTNSELGEIRGILIDNEPWMIGKDVAVTLGYTNPRKALADHVDEEDRKVLLKSQNVTLDIPNRGVTIINESGLYALIFSSKMPAAKEFKRWVTSEVLPSIRKHGAYMTPETLEAAILNPDVMIKLCMQLKEAQQKNQALEAANVVLTAENQEMKPKADYFDTLVNRNGLTGIRETAKELNLGQKKFTSFLIEKKYLYRDGRGNLQPYMQYVPTLFKVKECFVPYTTQNVTQTMITPLGRAKFCELCKNLN